MNYKKICTWLPLVFLIFLSFPLEKEAAAQTFSGVALKDPTYVYENTSSMSKKLKGYAKGSILRYQSYNGDWYKATVYIHGKARHGFISKNDVETGTAKSSVQQGVALKSPTYIYADASTKKAIKSYSQGSILKYQTFTSQWYKASVYVNGKFRTGYIYKGDVENAVSQPTLLEGIGLKSPTKIYSNASRSKAIKSYAQGSILKYQTFTSQWYKASVYVKGKFRTGYIYKGDVENAVRNPSKLQGIALKNPTYVYSSGSVNSKAVKGFKKGNILKFETYTNNWYRAEVFKNGKKYVGYIHKSHVETIYQKQTQMKGIPKHLPVKVYEKPSTDSKVIKYYRVSKVLSFKNFSPNWYVAEVTIGSKKYTGYFYKPDIITGPVFKKYNITLDDLVDKQMAVNPTTDLYGPTAYVAKRYIKNVKKSGGTYQGTVSVKSTLNVREKPSTNSRVVGRLSNGSKVTILDPKPIKGGNEEWYKIYYLWKLAKREDVEKYANPENFKYGSAEFYQFLNLAAPAGLDWKEVNAKILYDKGALKGTAEHFINAANQYGINEIYLMAHAFLETENGTSELAQGVRIKQNSDGSYTILEKDAKEGKLVYNFFGIGAYDSAPTLGGAIAAYKYDWTSIEKAIIGGAAFIGNNYIKAGQNTLYKMRWNPDYIQDYGKAYHQYATDIGWAVKQGAYFKQMYDLLDKKALFFEIPVYK